jgi:sarcosine oxidase subunit beta
MSDKTIVCRCEDVTVEELRAGLERGYRTIEELKRFTGLGTGPCQGKECMGHVAHLLEAAGVPPAEITPFTARLPRRGRLGP